MTGEPLLLAREELYDLVWSEPMRKLAPRVGLSDVGLAKICRKLRVPRPGRGYWRRIEVDRPVRRIPLPPLPKGSEQELGSVELAPRAERTPPAATGPVAEQANYEAKPKHRIVVPDALRPHPLVRRTADEVRRVSSSSQGYLSPGAQPGLDLKVTPGARKRALRIIDALIKALEKRRYPVSVAPDGDRAKTQVEILGEQVTVVLKEKTRRVERKADGLVPGHTWTSDDHVPTGLLRIYVTDYLGNGARTSWGDGKRQRLEECLNQVVVGLVAAAERLRILRLEREERERLWREEERRRQEARRRQEEERARVQELELQVAAWSKGRLIREYVAARREVAERDGGPEPGHELEAWLDWAAAYANRLDPTREEAPK